MVGAMEMFNGRRCVDKMHRIASRYAVRIWPSSLPVCLFSRTFLYELMRPSTRYRTIIEIACTESCASFGVSRNLRALLVRQVGSTWQPRKNDGFAIGNLPRGTRRRVHTGCTVASPAKLEISTPISSNYYSTFLNFQCRISR